MIFKKTPLSFALSAALLTTASAANADSWAIEEIVVTAQKRAESAQDVPIAISAFSADMVANTGADGVGDIIAMVPGFSGTTTSSTLNFWAIRGIASTDFTVGSEPSVGVFIDDAYIGRNIHAMTAFFDVDRIEVVKGPQGTLFGRNAVAGAISIVSKAPQNENSAQVGVGIGNEGQREYDLMGNLAVNDTLALRAAYHGTRLDGVIEDVVSNTDGGETKDALRVSALWNATDDLEARLTLSYAEADTTLLNGTYNPGLQQFNDTATSDDGSDFPEKTARSGKDEEHVRTLGADLRLTWDINDDLSLTSITDYRSFDFDYIQDVDGAQADTLLGAAFGLPPISVQFKQPRVLQESFSQEFRLNGSSDNLEWFVGASYFNERVDEEQVISVLDITGAAFGGDLDDLAQGDGETESLGVYGDASYDVNDQLSLTAGIRWSEDKKDWCSTGTNNSNLLGVMDTAGAPICGSEKWSEVTTRFVADYALTEEIMLYASYAEGYKGGGFNIPAVSTDNTNDFVLDLAGGFINTFDQAPYLSDINNVDPTSEQVFFTGEAVSSFDPETSTSYEIGLKSSFMDNQLQFNAAAFLVEYQDLQVQSATAAGIITSNAAEAETQGIELDVVYAVTENLVLMANWTYVDADFQEGSFAGTDLKGKNLPFAPEYAYSVSAAYDMSVGDGNVSVFTAYNWTDEYNNQADNAASLVQEDYGLWNAKVTYTPASESWDLAFSIDNIEDKGYTSWKQDIGLGLGTNYYRGMPRLWKVNFNTYF